MTEINLARDFAARSKAVAEKIVDIDAMSESQLENEIRRNPRGITGAIERLELGR